MTVRFWIVLTEWKRVHGSICLVWRAISNKAVCVVWHYLLTRMAPIRDLFFVRSGAPTVNFRKISVRKTIWDLEIFGTFVVKCLACLSLLGWYNCPFLTYFYPKRSPRIFGSLFLAEIFEKVSFDPYDFRNNRLLARKSEQMKIFRG